MRKIIAFILVIFSGFVFFQCGPRQATQTTQQKQTPEKTAKYLLDTVITKQIPLTVDGDWATINYHLKVIDWKKPVEWTYEFIKGKDTLFAVISNEVEIDTFFNDKSYIAGFVDDTLDYLRAKKFWYLTRIAEYLCDTIEVSNKRTRVDWKRLRNGVMKTETIDLKEITIDYDSLWSFYSNKPIIGYSFFAGKPIQADPGLWTYYPKINQFVCIYAP
ncbi:MAG: hypothetical protein A2509_09310 [Candidatus Edwardsbacteria bacterium RIFOXYD12_FULL_50_11]|uniref:Uncharacterized protein n=1 Tax=Candidatus Edwardsbacteria bacterium GWF2_54_11 TaxID=1817851 RepID=A0A1F5R613_9BACT|nr:MAG: hypothetical protein A2502_08560 [Candidatus Edwardsbacteria bacterium RifOxyC12_full_54_24]OGF07359.1 MAG: hypothetical protein A2273_02495 [Candidatus Edwardsbacteria bacterium RifOxyA12_full_54_48]OGF09351.1 MAG: hypothetical protein A2024_08695 [Candidatus Edwardsbacteria bacterium GWF2_54_11]OGF09611.1 MAG: hypothetical protein A3K15_08905 [Candidatus Edwardsbacteria bacterium GWE2_54_12]OGF18054.1 MAG: hypothetical protein A2509_09310 [Candidatus Edwardsbacteria bacterium RIFOXYD1